MGDDTALADRIDQLEAEVASLRETVNQQQEIIAILAAGVESEALPEMDCPYCDAGALTTRSGLTWEQVVCTNCDFAEYTSR